MNQRIPHTEPTTNSPAAAYGYKYEDFIDQAILDKTLYTSPYMIVTGREYTKHYYIESQRVTTKLGGGMANNLVDPISGTLSAIEGNVNIIAQELMENLIADSCTEKVEIEVAPIFRNIDELMQQDNDEGNLYFYHADHLGSSSWITDASGNVNQHLAYLPYGEQFIDERNDSHDIRFKFTGKERDTEIKPLGANSPNTTENKLFMRQTGLDYFGARYYSSGLSVWLSVDALAGKYPNQSPYGYVGNKPIMVIDPDGRDEFEIDKKTGKIKKLNSNKYYQDGDNIITVKEGTDYSGKKDLSKLKEVDKLNNHNGDSEYFTAKTISATNDKEFQIFAFRNQDEAETFYYFAARSSDVEWGFGKVKPQFEGGAAGYVGSNFSDAHTRITYMIEKAYGKNVTFLSHSHPGSGGPPSYDIRDKNRKLVGDLNHAAKENSLEITREVFDPVNGFVYGYGKYTLIRARNTKIPYDYKEKKQ